MWAVPGALVFCDGGVRKSYPDRTGQVEQGMDLLLSQGVTKGDEFGIKGVVLWT